MPIPLGITFIPREIENNGYAKFCEVNMVYYGLGGKSESGGERLLTFLPTAGGAYSRLGA